MSKNDLFGEDNLQTRIEKTIGTKGLEKIELPLDILQNLNKELREYQKNALRYYFANFQNEKFQQRHLLFNMATGSGKTLLMAALILDCYKNGYRNFLFFVNSTAVLEKTKDNFINLGSEKYLFAKNINIKNQKVEINVVDNFDESKEDAINIVFSSIQGLHSLLRLENPIEKENAITFDDLKNHKIVFLADESHHLNANTKKQQEEEDKKSGWEYIINKAFTSNAENLMFEFTATIPNYEVVEEKYKDKLIFEYNLKRFCADKFSKKIFLLKYENRSIENRFLGAILLNVFRQLLAQKYLPKHPFKPVMLFKSESIKTGINSSKEMQKRFLEFVKNLKAEEINRFYLFSGAENQKLFENNELLGQSKTFFKEYFGENFSPKVLEFIQGEFNEDVCLNVNDKEAETKYQLLLNNLENIDNKIRVIFAVDKLNEGWDVLNLFDIIRTKSDGNSTSKTTTKEAQLIGRGARYYPFPWRDKDLYKRKFEFDETRNEEREERHPLRALESLTYHTIDSVDFINNLNKELERLGLVQEKSNRVILNLNKKAKIMLEKGIKEIPLALNWRDKAKDLLDNQKEDKKPTLRRILRETPHISPKGINPVQEIEAFKKDDIEEQKMELNTVFSLNEIPLSIWQKALNKTRALNFKILHQDFNFASRLDFIKFVQSETCIIQKNQKNSFFDKQSKLEIALSVLDHVQKKLYENKSKQKIDYRVLDFKINYYFQLESPREIWSKKEAISSTYDWLVYDKCLKDSNLELEFLEFIENHKSYIDKIFSNWLVIRNEQYEDLALYDNNRHSPYYAEVFYPDFIFWGEYKSGDKIAIECFMESKGEHLLYKDEWKEKLLTSLKGECIQKGDNKIYVEGLCFFRTRKQNEKFQDAFFNFINKHQEKSTGSVKLL